MNKSILFWAFFVVSVASIHACHPGKSKKIEIAEPKFSTSDASELFFKNIRQSYYDKEEMKDAKLDVYKIKDRKESALLQPVIVINWRYDEAYLLLEPNTQLQELDSVKINWEDTVINNKGFYVFTQGNKEDQFRLATQIYNSLQDQHQLYILGEDNQKQPFFQKPTDREAFRKTMFDYFRLVDLL